MNIFWFCLFYIAVYKCVAVFFDFCKTKSTKISRLKNKNQFAGFYQK